MKERSVGEILYILRMECGVRQEKLCLGLCNTGTYYRYECGERVPDRLLLNALLQRMGKNPEKLSTILTVEEYRYFLWKKKMLTAVGQEDIEKVEQLLKEPEALEIAVNQNLQKQFVYQMQAVVEMHRGKDIKKCITWLEQSVEMTMPGMQVWELEQQMLGAEEVMILLKLGQTLIQGEREQEARQLLLKVVKYVEKHYHDYETKVKIYPKAVKLLVPLMIRDDCRQEGMVLCRKAVKLLCWQGILYDLLELMELYLTCCAEFPDTEEARRYRKQVQALREVYAEFHGEKYQTDKNYFIYSNQELYLVDEVIKRSRIERDISQEFLCEGICSPETLSRIENGKRGPNYRNFQALMNKLDMNLDYYNGELDTDDFLLLEKKLELNRAISMKNWEEARELIEELKEKLDMRSPKNKMVMQIKESCILYFTGELGVKEFRKCCEKAMDCQEEGWRTEGFWKQFFTLYKVKIMNYIAVSYRREQQVEKSIFILEHLLEQLVSSKVKLADRYKSSMTVIENLSSQYGEDRQLEKCQKMCDLGIDLCLECGRGIRLGKFLANKAEALNDKAGKITEKSKQYFKNAYYINDLFSVHSSVEYVDNYYRTYCEADIVWY